MKRVFMWWLTRRALLPRGVRLSAAVVMGALALIGLATPSGSAQSGTQPDPSPNYPSNGPGGPPHEPNPPSKSSYVPGPGDLTKTFPRSPQLQAEGYNLYNERCSSCHGLDLNGIPGVAPSLRQAGAGPLDFYLSTGRMPLDFPRDEPLRQAPVFNRKQINAIIAYVTKFGGPPAPAVHPSDGDLSLGRHEFTLHCAGCHQQVGRGGMFVGAFVPNLEQATGQQVAEAVRMGPYFMPHFDDSQIDQHELDSLARYVLWTRNPNNAGGWAIYNIGPIPEGLVAWWLGLGSLLIVARLIGERLDERTGTRIPTSDGG